MKKQSGTVRPHLRVRRYADTPLKFNTNFSSYIYFPQQRGRGVVVFEKQKKNWLHRLI
jgi:hypothetical protein